jgi:hypothetical protein
MIDTPSPAARIARGTLSRKGRGLKRRSWDKEIERDSMSGKLDPLVENATREHLEGKSRPL